ncbi:MAG: hypothetical protein K0U74_13570 [Alphaproteobacteria bacterium]|nr:hypothetical protein [Alphaproteobacteria bacterium]
MPSPSIHAQSPLLKTTHQPPADHRFTDQFPVAFNEPITSTPTPAPAGPHRQLLARLDFVPTGMKAMIAAMLTIRRIKKTSVASYRKTLTIAHPVGPGTWISNDRSTPPILKPAPLQSALQPLRAAPVRLAALAVTRAALITSSRTAPRRHLTTQSVAMIGLDLNGFPPLPIRKPITTKAYRYAIQRLFETRKRRQAARARELSRKARKARARKVANKKYYAKKAATKKTTAKTKKKAPTIAPIGSNWTNSALFPQ